METGALESKRDSLAKDAYDKENPEGKSYDDLTAKEKEQWQKEAANALILSRGRVDENSKSKEPA